MRAKHKVLIVGFGDIGKRVARLLPKSYQIHALVRNSPGIGRARRLGVQTIAGDLSRRYRLCNLADRFDTVFHFAPPPVSGRRDGHTRNLLQALAPARLRPAMLTRRAVGRIVYISTTGVYGDQAGAWVDESTRVAPSSPRALRRVDAERAIAGFGKRHRIDTFILRAPGIYSSDRLPIERIAKGMPALVEVEDVFTNHIHADDLANLCVLAMKSRQPGLLVNTVDDSEMCMGEYFDAIADAYGLPRPPRVTRDEAKRTLSPAMFSFMQESRRIRNSRLKRRLKAKLMYPTVGTLLAQLEPACSAESVLASKLAFDR